MTRKRNILYLAHRVPFPPNKGDKIRTFHQIERLAASHNVWCGCFVDTSEDRVHAAALHQWCRGVMAVEWNRNRARLRALKALAGGGPLTLAAYESDALRRKIAQVCERVRFDVVTCFSACMAPIALEVPARRHVLDLCDADSEKWRDYADSAPFPASLLYAEEHGRLREYELACLRRFNATLVITQREREILDPGGRHRKLHVVTNGADLPMRAPAPASTRAAVISFIGAMDYRPNVEGIRWFVRWVWPLVREEAPHAKLMVVGRNPSAAVRCLDGRAGISVIGEVSDVRPWLAGSRAVVAPLQIARGLQNKVLEAMAMRRPVVATPAVARCLDARPGRHLLVGADAGAFARGVLALCRSDRLCDAVGEAGYRFVAGYHSWPEAMARYESIVLGDLAVRPKHMDAKDRAESGDRPATVGQDVAPSRTSIFNRPYPGRSLQSDFAARSGVLRGLAEYVRT